VAGSRPWPIGSTNGSVWNVVFAYNGIDRLSATATKAALALDPPGPLRLFATDGRHYAALVGSTLLAALVLGGLALLVARRGPRERSAVAGAAFFATWLLVGVALISHMQRLQPRYLEAVTPAIAGVVGIGLASLAVRAPRLLAAGSAVVAVVAVALVHPPATATVLALAAAGLAVVVALVRRPARIALGACALVAVLAVPTASAISVARAHQSDAGLQVRIPGLDALSAFLIAHQGTARYEAASTSTFSASPLIVRDGRPVLMLTSYHGRPLLQAAQLARLVRDGEVRYLLVGGGGGSGVVRWARSHARAVTVPGVPKGTVFRLTSAG
jgi:hypothetical protein